MTPNRCKTLVGIPRPPQHATEVDHEPFQLRARMVPLPAPRPMVSTHTRLRLPAPEPRATWLGGLKEFSVSAAVVFMLGCLLLALCTGCAGADGAMGPPGHLIEIYRSEP